jgi:hypothetical protein
LVITVTATRTDAVIAKTAQARWAHDSPGQPQMHFRKYSQDTAEGLGWFVLLPHSPHLILRTLYAKFDYTSAWSEFMYVDDLKPCHFAFV